MVSEDELKAGIIHKLMRRNKWGHSHTSIDNITKGFPSHLGKELKKAAKELIKEGLIIPKPTSYGLEISLNPERGDEIKRINRKFFGKKQST